MSRVRISARLAAQILADAGHLCGYCHTDEHNTGSMLSIEHIIPVADGGTNDRDNLWRSCRECNQFKGAQTHAFDPDTEDFAPLYDPRRQRWTDHFRWSEDGVQIIGTTAIGRATVIAISLNRRWLQNSRQRWIMAGWHPPLGD